MRDSETLYNVGFSHIYFILSSTQKIILETCKYSLMFNFAVTQQSGKQHGNAPISVSPFKALAQPLSQFTTSVSQELEQELPKAKKANAECSEQQSSDRALK